MGAALSKGGSAREFVDDAALARHLQLEFDKEAQAYLSYELGVGEAYAAVVLGTNDNANSHNANTTAGRSGGTTSGSAQRNHSGDDDAVTMGCWRLRAHRPDPRPAPRPPAPPAPRFRPDTGTSAGATQHWDGAVREHHRQQQQQQRWGQEQREYIEQQQRALRERWRSASSAGSLSSAAGAPAASTAAAAPAPPQRLGSASSSDAIPLYPAIAPATSGGGGAIGAALSTAGSGGGASASAAAAGAATAARAEAGSSRAAASTAGSEADDAACVVCLSAPRDAGLLHGASVHRCVCGDCARMLWRTGGRHCPMCRQKIEKLVLVYE